MTTSLAYMLGSGNSLIWSWFFWIYVHPIASIIWFSICIFALVISMEVRQFEQNGTSSLTYSQSSQLLQYGSTGLRTPDIIDVVVIPPPQLPSSKRRSVKNGKPQVAAVTITQLSNGID